MIGKMKRREFITLLGGAAAAWPLAARAQQAGKLLTIGFLGPTTPLVEGQRLAAFVQRLRELGWMEGRNITMEVRWAEGRSERYAEIAAELVRLKVDIIVTYATAPVLAARQVTSVIPIVFASAGDPSRTGPRRDSGAAGRQRHRPVKPATRHCCQATPTLARSRPRSAPVGDLG
jgi:putative ABC transport system substrate-binding protein